MGQKCRILAHARGNVGIHWLHITLLMHSLLVFYNLCNAICIYIVVGHFSGQLMKWGLSHQACSVRNRK